MMTRYEKAADDHHHDGCNGDQCRTMRTIMPMIFLVPGSYGCHFCSAWLRPLHERQNVYALKGRAFGGRSTGTPGQRQGPRAAV